MVTTKKGRIGRPIVNYNLTTTFRQRPSYNDRAINVMNSRERMQFSRELVAQHYPFPDDINMVGYEGLLNQLYNHELTDEQFEKEVERLSVINTDWFDLLTKNSVSHSHTISISGGSSEATYYASIGYTRDNDVVWDSNNERYTATMKMNTNLTSWFNASLNVNGNVSTSIINRNYLRWIMPIKQLGRYPHMTRMGNIFIFRKENGEPLVRNIIDTIFSMNWKTVPTTSVVLRYLLRQTYNSV